jgi:Haem-binding domain/Cytochrome P460
MQTTKRGRLTKIAISVGLLLLLGLFMQFIGPAVTNPPVTGKMDTPAEVAAIYQRACYDCHSNETKLAWYDKIAPISWLVAKDVREGRARFNFSEWNKLSESDRQAILWETVNQITSKKMPLADYATMHPDAKVSTRGIETLKGYVKTLSNGQPADTVAIVAAANAADAELRGFKKGAHFSRELPRALNGVSYVSDYRNWQVITTPNRFDNNTIRVLYGNDIAVKAIRENRINPFPDGAEVVKIVWNKITDTDGHIRPGAFSSAQIMVQDKNKYKQTGGWGFALFAGLKLVPAGKTAAFQIGCYNCHKDLAASTGYVFDVPLRNSDLGIK